MVKLDASDIKNSAAPMISAGSPARCRAWRLNGFPSPKSHALLISVRNGPGINVLTRTVGPNAAASPLGHRVQPGLGGGVRDERRMRAQRTVGADIDDHPPAAVGNHAFTHERRKAEGPFRFRFITASNSFFSLTLLSLS